MSAEAGKGDDQRLAQVPDEVVKQNWETIFGKRERKQWKYEDSQENSDLLHGRDVSGSGSLPASE